MADKKENYVITRKGVVLGLGDKKVQHEIGDEVKLTAKQAANLSGKVQAKAEHVEASKTVKQLQAEINKLTKQNAALTEQIEKLTEQLTAAPEGTDAGN